MHFEKVKFEAFKKDVREKSSFQDMTDQEIETIYNSIELPERSTKGSCGYDFKFPFYMTKLTEENIVIPTGIKAYLEPGKFLMLVPRSSSGKHGYAFANTIGIIDSDYYCNEDNDGDILFTIFSRAFHSHTFDHKDKIGQGIICNYFLTKDDTAQGVRTGGHGSTGA